MRQHIKIFILAFMTVLSSCGPKTPELVTREFPNVSLPKMIESQSDVIDYLSLHYWDEMTKPAPGFTCDTAYVAGVEKGIVEQEVSNYLYLLDHMALNKAQKSMAVLAGKLNDCEKADTSSNVFESFLKIVEKYAYDPNSPMRNDDYYKPFAATMSKSPYLDDEVKKRYEREARLCALNQKGTKAADFRFVDSKGKERTLYGTENPYTLVLFSNPGCENCKQIIDTLRNDMYAKLMVPSGKLAILNIYIDENLDEWKEYLPAYPQDWINGFDPDLVLRGDSIYSIRAIPSMYFLDKDKKVILKDAPLEKILERVSYVYDRG